MVSESHIRHALGITSKQDINQLNKLLNSDKRFVDCEESKWKCADLSDIVEDKPLDEVTFVVTDIETTGSIRGRDRIIEIAALKVRNGKILDRFESLVNPHKPISRQITKLTKISNATVKDSPSIESVLPEYVEYAGDGIFVAHNSMFDFCFINSELRRLNLEGLSNQTDICTYRLAKKLLPDVRARGIKGLSLHFNYPIKERHRAMPDVEATNHFLMIFLDSLKKMDIHSLHQLIEFQKDKLGRNELKKKLKKQRKKNYLLRLRN